MRTYNINFTHDGISYTATVNEYSNAVEVTTLIPSHAEVPVPITWEKQRDKSFNARTTKEIPASLIAAIAVN